MAENGAFVSTRDIARGTVILEETPILEIPPVVSAAWKKLAKKVSKLEPDTRPADVAETMPGWSGVSLNEAIIRLLSAFDMADADTKARVLEIYNPADESTGSPFDSLIKKAKVVITKDASKVGIKKSTLASLEPILRILTGKVCVPTEGGAVLYRQLGKVPHSCAPNCMFIPRGTKGHLVAIRDIPAGDPLSCSHIPTNCLRSSTDIRQSWLRGVAGSRCRGSCCNAGYDVRRRVICVRCHPMEWRDTSEFTGSDQSAFCLAARCQDSGDTFGKWIGSKCDCVMEESEALDVAKETSMVKKILFLNESSTDMDLTRLSLLTKASVSDAIKSFGKNHFSYQQLLLLECGLALHSLSGQTLVSASSFKMFVSWMKMVVDIARFSEVTALPFDGMDELVRILIAPDTLQMAVRLIGAVSVHKCEHLFREMLGIFTQMLDKCCECLVLIEGADSPHSSDGTKLRNWWKKKYFNWLHEKKIPVSPNGESVVSTEITDDDPDTSNIVQPADMYDSVPAKSSSAKWVLVGSGVLLVAGIALWSSSRLRSRQ